MMIKKNNINSNSLITMISIDNSVNTNADNTN